MIICYSPRTTIKILVIATVLIINFVNNAWCQYSNDWVSTSSKYVKIKLVENGIYRITQEDLKEVGLIDNQINGRDFRMIHMGKEIPIFVSQDNFTSGDYIEFYGKKQTVELDSFLFENWNADLFNPKYAFVTDTNTYFLAISPNTSNLRYSIINPNYNNNSLNPLTHYMHQEDVVYSSNAYKNTTFQSSFNSLFDKSEGFGTTPVVNSTTKIPVSNLFRTGPNARLELRIGTNNTYNKISIKFNDINLGDVELGFSQSTRASYEIAPSALISLNDVVLQNTYSNIDRHRLAYVSLVYPRQFVFNNLRAINFELESSLTRRFIKVNEFDNSGETVVYDVNNALRYSTLSVGSETQVILNPTIKSNHLWLVNNTNGYKKPEKMSLFEPLSFLDQQTDYLIITHNALRGNNIDYVREYADYRASEQGGSFKPRIVDVNDIYDHFGYGVERHFLGIKFFANYIADNWRNLKHIFIIGKGLEYHNIRTEQQILNNDQKIHFVPTYGYRGSDNLLFSKGNDPVLLFSVGRLAARTPADIKTYLDKVKKYENLSNVSSTIEDRAWMKKILHLGGGTTPTEQENIKRGLEGMEKILTDTIFGAEVTSFYKTSSANVDFNTNEKINTLFNNGLSIVNFFGHSSANTWDFPIENPRNYTNYNRFPFINSLGCYAGNMFDLGRGISEAFVLEKDRGSIGFLASSGAAIIPDLIKFGNIFFYNMTKERNFATYGELIKEVTTNTQFRTNSEKLLLTQLVYHGDPALKPRIFDRPDYVFDNNLVRTEPQSVLANDAKYTVSVEVVNLGRATHDSVYVKFEHILPDGSVIDTQLINVGVIESKKNITIELKNYGDRSVGKNILRAIIDPYNSIDEGPLPQAELNNTLANSIGYEYFITDDIAIPIYPPNFAMINSRDKFVLKASTSSVPVSRQEYIIQLDTTMYFNSPLLVESTVFTSGGVLEYRPTISPVSDWVYYWRVSPRDKGQGFKWSNASFAYIPYESEGWNQSHFFQLEQNDYEDLYFSEETGRNFELGRQYSNVKIRNKVWSQEDRPGYTFNNVLFGSSLAWNWIDAGIYLIPYSQENGRYLSNQPGGLYGSINPTNGTTVGFAYRTDTPQNRKAAMDFIETEITKGRYLHFYTIQRTALSDYMPQNWAADTLIYGKSLFTVLEKLGATRVRELENTGSVPYIFQVANGSDGVLAELIAQTPQDIIETNVNVYNRRFDGRSTSVNIDILKDYSNVKFQFDQPPGNRKGQDVYIFAKKEFAPTDTVASKIFNGIDIGAITKNIGQINLHKFVYDSIGRVSPQLRYWRTSGTFYPDLAITFVKSEPENIEQELTNGEKVKITYDVENTSFFDIDNFDIKYSLFGGVSSHPEFKNISQLKAGEKIRLEYEFAVLSNSAEVKIAIEVNHDKRVSEYTYFNNILSSQLKVRKDNDTPNLDVYFDGIRILDGDIVSAKPEILIMLEDKNTFLPITDKNSFEIKLDTGINQYLTVDLDGDNVIFSPASASNPVAKIQYFPKLREGEYKLIVQGKDMSGNKAGQHPQTVMFRVIEKKSISNVLNYPNPFSTSTQFVFTLTGDKIPDVLSITIMTVTGKVVKEIRKEELGQLRIGVNRTEYRWDGTDDWGSKLANGVYLYKVNVRNNDDGNNYENFNNTKVDKYFKEGFGKLVILR